MGRPRVYGTKHRNVQTAAGLIFGSGATSGTAVPSATLATSAPRETRSKALEDWRSVAHGIDEVSKESTKAASDRDESYDSSQSSEPKEDEDSEEEGEASRESEEEFDGGLEELSENEDSNSAPLNGDSNNADYEHSSIGQSYYGEPAPKHLSILADAYKTDRGTELIVSKWSEVIPTTASITKIAEASFAEVYRVKTPDGTSIIKVLQLKIPTDPDSAQIETAIEAADLVAEIRIMNVLAEVPGFVGFKDAHLIKGKFAPALHAAYTQYLGEDSKDDEGDHDGENDHGGYDEGEGEEEEEEEEEEEPRSYFPDPDIFTNESTFLVLELADAGTVLDECEVTTIDQVWDLLLGVIMALSRAEVICEFEHRDLHENNICVRQKHTTPTHNPSLDGDLKYGFSGYAVTIIDYGLSRAKVHNGDVVFQDLEKDLSLFHGDSGGTHGMQFDNYRRHVPLPLKPHHVSALQDGMRNHLFTGLRTMQAASWHDEASRSPSRTNRHTWAEHIPYSNVLWIRYILSYLTKTFKKSSRSQSVKEQLRAFEADTRDLKRRLDVRTKVENGAFSSATEVLNFVYGRGWVGESQLEDFGMESTA
ncbi:hypothetical protein B2J93_7646 [Marssonina coronariae]|uniref:non-specific serine/threonine protein kinase n=1 Tax=Diplocarpon coronariae TaxID=2795749 RepID=A0A218ZDT7_9HELO|nr:hypothetical protein B2J93_7646 [Marssonina coronariae]